MKHKSSGKIFAGVVALLIFLSVPIWIENRYLISVITLMFINSLLASSCWFIMTTGQVTLGHAGFAAIGGYISAALTSKFTINSWLSLLIALILSGFISFLIGYITLQIKGIYFIVATLSLGEVIRILFSTWREPFGGLVGMMNLPPPNPLKIPFLFNIPFSNTISLYYLTMLFSVLGILIMFWIYSSPIGLIFQGIRQADDLAENVGIDTMGYKVLAFVTGSIFAGLAGILYTYNIKSIQPSSFTLIQSTHYLLYVAVGGGANILGPIIGAFSLNILSELLRPIKEFEPIVFALILIGTVILFPGGLLGLIKKLERKMGEMIFQISNKSILLGNFS